MLNSEHNRRSAWYRKTLKFYRKKRTNIKLYKSEARKGDYVKYFIFKGLEPSRLYKLNLKTLRMMFNNTNIKDAKQAYADLMEKK